MENMEENRQTTKQPLFNDANSKPGDEQDRALVFSHPSSRIFKVSRATGGKDRHSKVFTSKGLRDRRVRLSVSTAIQFYDLQDRLGYDQPSKAIEWLIKAASAAIAQLPSLAVSFPVLPSLVKNTKINTEAEVEAGCSSASETSKGSVLSLSRSEIRVKARERARRRTAKDKAEKREDAGEHFATNDQNAQNVNESSFTEPLTADPPNPSQTQQQMPPSTVTEDYFGQASFFARSPLPGMTSYSNPEMQQFSLINEHMDYNLNFSIASGLAGFQRGTLQSNASSHLNQNYHNLFPFSSTSSSSSMDVLNYPFIFGAMPAPPAEAHFHSVFDGRLHLSSQPTTPFCLDGYRPSDLKGKRKS